MMITDIHNLRRVLLVGAVFVCGCNGEPAAEQASGIESASPGSPEPAAEGFILRAGEGEKLLRGITVKASPATGTLGSILVEQSFTQNAGTRPHLHEQGDELFYVVSGRGTATLNGRTEPIGPGDVIFVPRHAVHAIRNPGHGEALRVVFFMDSSELVEEFRAIHRLLESNPGRELAPEELAKLRERIGGSRTVP